MNKQQQILMALMEQLFDSIGQMHLKQCGEIKKECDYGNDEDDMHIIMNNLLNLYDFLDKQYLGSIVSNHTNNCPDRSH